MKIEVTQEDIEKGKRGSKCYCPIALALMRAQPTRCVSVGALTVALDLPRVCLNLPHRVRCWIYDFDSGEAVAPFEFDLDLPEKPAA